MYEWKPNGFGYAVMLLFLVALWLCANVVLREITEYWRFWGFLFAVFTLITVPRIIEFLIKKYIDWRNLFQTIKTNNMSWIGVERGPVTTREELIYEIQAIFRYYDFHNKGTLWLEKELNKLMDEYEVENKAYIKRLEDRDEWLQCLENAGVDNWEGFSLAQDIKNGII